MKMTKRVALNKHDTLTGTFQIVVIGDQPGYFSLTGEISDSRRAPNDRIASAGCLHDEITKAWPELADAMRMHLSNADTGEPMHAAANGWYWYAGAVVEAGLEKPEGAGKYIGEPTGGRSCAAIFADHCRIGESLAAELIQKRMTSQQFHEWIGEQRPRWQAQADAIKARYFAG